MPDPRRPYDNSCFFQWFAEQALLQLLSNRRREYGDSLFDLEQALLHHATRLSDKEGVPRMFAWEGAPALWQARIPLEVVDYCRGLQNPISPPFTKRQLILLERICRISSGQIVRGRRPVTEDLEPLWKRLRDLIATYSERSDETRRWQAIAFCEALKRKYSSNKFRFGLAA